MSKGERTLRVRATAGLRVPLERSRRWIGEEPTTVPETQYYLRRVAGGELVIVEEQSR